MLFLPRVRMSNWKAMSAHRCQQPSTVTLPGWGQGPHAKLCPRAPSCSVTPLNPGKPLVVNTVETISGQSVRYHWMKPVQVPVKMLVTSSEVHVYSTPQLADV